MSGPRFPSTRRQVFFPRESLSMGVPDPVVQREIDELTIAEPVGSVPPRLPPRTKSDVVVSRLNSVEALLCDAQGQPVPSFR